ncbi:MAG: hypothetical protein K6G18_07840 [Treponema sp.]|nr:hypothetical protein [Treponema sp.]
MSRHVTSIVLAVAGCLAASFLAAGCSNGTYDPLIEEYNENFVTIEDTDGSQYSVNDADFDASRMLRDLYSVSRRTMTNFAIVGPQDGESYEWSICETVSGVSVNLPGVDMGSRTFSVYLPNTTLKEQTMYTVSLSVTNRAGTVFTDSGRLWIEDE